MLQVPTTWSTAVEIDCGLIDMDKLEHYIMTNWAKDALPSSFTQFLNVLGYDAAIQQNALRIAANKHRALKQCRFVWISPRAAEEIEPRQKQDR